MENLEIIIKGCKDGKKDAQRTLYNLFQRKMYGVCLRYCNNYAEAEDAAQEGFIKVFKNIHKFKNTGPLEAWIRKIMVHTILEKYRKTSPLYLVEDAHEYESVSDCDDIISSLSARDIIAIIQELSPQYKLAFNLYEIEGYTHAEIAEMLGIAESTSRSNLLRAKFILQKKILKHFSYSKTLKKINDVTKP